MKFTINKDEFIHNLSAADSIINVKSPLAILLNIYVEALEDGSIILLSFNGDHGVKVEATGVVEQPGKISLLSKKLLEVIRKVPGNHVVLETDSDSPTQILIHPENKSVPEFHLNGVSGDTYPVFNEFNWENYIRISQDILEEQIKATEFSASIDTSKPAFTGTFVKENVDGYLSFVTTNGRRLSVITRAYEEKHGEVETNVIIPQKIFKTLLNSLSSGDVWFSVHKNQAFFKANNVYVFANLVDGKFPNFNDVIPTEHLNVFHIQADDFVSAIDIVSVMSDPDTCKIHLEVAHSTLTLSATHPIYGLAKQEVAVEYDGEDIGVSINYKALADFLKFIAGKEAEITINSKSSPLLLKTINDDHYLYVTMPMKDFD